MRTPTSDESIAALCESLAATDPIALAQLLRELPQRCRVGGRRTCLRIRWQFRRFRFGPQSGFHNRVSSRRSPNRACGFPAPGSPGGSCISHSEEPSRTRSFVQWRWAPSIACSTPLTTRSQACLRLDYHVPRHSRSALPSLSHVMSPRSPTVTRLLGLRHCRGLSLFEHLSAPAAPFLCGHYPASTVIRATPPPC